ncbi:MAG: hypothetical protein QY332_10865 [Anaerolineales bacterium]|nr:MAG: hypothetical protein QY332_10865 [Anaerolineales bacterium]
MTLTIPLLDIFVSAFLGFLSIFAFCQGWSISFGKKATPLFPYFFISKLADLIGKGDVYRERMSYMYTLANIKKQGIYGLIGGALGFCGSVLFFIDAVSRIEFYSAASINLVFVLT